MRFRPCIDIHNGKVKQIVGGSLRDEGDSARDNFVSEHRAGDYARMYRDRGLSGGHVIILNPAGSPWYEEDLEQAREAFAAFPGGLMIGGGVNEENAPAFLEMGASHVIVTSYVFRDGIIDFDRLKRLHDLVGRDRLVLDLSCRKKDDTYLVVTDRWQKFTRTALSEETLDQLMGLCSEFLVHAVDVEGRASGIEEGVAALLGSWHKIPVTYAGGISSMDDIRLLGDLGKGHLDFTVGSALDLFGGHISFEKLAASRF